MTKRQVRHEPGCTMWRVTNNSGEVNYEVKCGIHKLQYFACAEAADEYFELWAAEVGKALERPLTYLRR